MAQQKSDVVVALDAMGGDRAPEEVVRGAALAARRYDVRPLLVGQPERLEPLLAAEARGLGLAVVPSGDAVRMDEHAVEALRGRRDSSIAVALALLKEGRAQAVVSAGHSGATMAAALLTLGRLAGVARPAIGVVVPSREKPAMLVDAGANADCRPQYLVQFARMGEAYMRSVFGIARPRVALLSIGEEPSKGNRLALEAHALLAASGLDFVGNIEGRDLPRGAADVVVTDGFTGNVVLKTAEGVAELLVGLLRAEMRRRPQYILGALLLRPALRAVMRRLDYAEYGAAPLLGVRGSVFIAHGRSDARAIASAVRAAAEAARTGVVDALARAAERGFTAEVAETHQ